MTYTEHIKHIQNTYNTTAPYDLTGFNFFVLVLDVYYRDKLNHSSHNKNDWLVCLKVFIFKWKKYYAIWKELMKNPVLWYSGYQIEGCYLKEKSDLLFQLFSWFGLLKISRFFFLCWYFLKTPVKYTVYGLKLYRLNSKNFHALAIHPFLSGNSFKIKIRYISVVM